MNTKKFFKTFDLVLLTLLFTSITILPLIKIYTWLYIGIEDFLMPIIFLRLLTQLKRPFSLHIYFLLFFMAYIVLTIFVNGREGYIRDYFELYKMGKFIITVYFASIVLRNWTEHIGRAINIFFIILIVFNVFHYFDLLSFNTYIEPFYATTEIQLSTFGLDSLGNPSVRRMLGTMGNPNNNGILFLFFFSYYLSSLTKKPSYVIRFFLYLSFLCIILTQSRTGLFTGLVVYLFWVIYTQQRLKLIIIDLICFTCTFGVALSFDALALNYFGNAINTEAQGASQMLLSNHSVMGRLEVWQHLSEMIKNKPIFGHGPNKDYFYDNGLYAESEYVLYTWRYGITGLILYLGWVLIPLYKNFRLSMQFPLYILATIVILISATTNCPLTNPRILLLFAIYLGYFNAYCTEKRVSNEN